jgi:curved DNA-binding protein
VNEDGFTDYYELLQLSSNVDGDTVERVFRYLAKKFHPDNRESGDIDRFRQIVEAHRILSNPESRAAYDVKYQDHWNRRWKLASEAGNPRAFDDEWETRESLLSILYFQRRNDMRNPGMGNLDLARLLSKPIELMEFHMWYLKAKGWVERLEDGGQLAITALGVDHVEQGRLRLRKDRLLTPGGIALESAEGRTTHLGSEDLPEFPKGTDFNEQ